MGIWIRSQKKNILVQAKAFSVYKSALEVDFGIYGFAGSESEGFTVARYSTEERALQVLDEIQQALLSSTSSYAIRGFIGKDRQCAAYLQNYVYEMPAE